MGAFKKLLVASYNAVSGLSLRSSVVSLYQVNVLFVSPFWPEVSSFLKLSFSEVRCYWYGFKLR